MSLAQHEESSSSLMTSYYEESVKSLHTSIDQVETENITGLESQMQIQQEHESCDWDYICDEIR